MELNSIKDKDRRDISPSTFSSLLLDLHDCHPARLAVVDFCWLDFQSNSHLLLWSEIQRDGNEEHVKSVETGWYDGQRQWIVYRYIKDEESRGLMGLPPDNHVPSPSSLACSSPSGSPLILSLHLFFCFPTNPFSSPLTKAAISNIPYTKKKQTLNPYQMLSTNSTSSFIGIHLIWVPFHQLKKKKKEVHQWPTTPAPWAWRVPSSSRLSISFAGMISHAHFDPTVFVALK